MIINLSLIKKKKLKILGSIREREREKKNYFLLYKKNN